MMDTCPQQIQFFKSTQSNLEEHTFWELARPESAKGFITADVEYVNYAQAVSMMHRAARLQRLL